MPIVCLHWGKVKQGSGFFQQQAAAQMQDNCFEPFHSDEPEVLQFTPQSLTAQAKSPVLSSLEKQSILDKKKVVTLKTDK